MKKAKRVSKIAKGRMAKSQVFKGRKMKTIGGLKQSDLKKNKSGKIVSKKMSAQGQKSKWMAAVAKARKELGIISIITDGLWTKVSLCENVSPPLCMICLCEN